MYICDEMGFAFDYLKKTRNPTRSAVRESSGLCAEIHQRTLTFLDSPLINYRLYLVVQSEPNLHITCQATSQA